MAPKKDVARRIEKLRQEINRHNYLYYVKNEPEISDREFDALMEELQRLESEYPELVTPDSPTQKVGGQPIDEFRTAAHIVPMLSMDNTYNEDEVREFHKRVMKWLGPDAPPAYVVEPKIDGVAINLIYEGGSLLRAITRGNGQLGDDVTHNARTVKDLPLRLFGGARGGRSDLAGSLIEIRGEVYMPFKAFERVNKVRAQEGLNLFANPRNATAGSLKLLDPSEAAKRGLRVFTYEVGHFEGIDVPDSHWQTLELLRALGCPTNPRTEFCPDLNAVLRVCTRWEAGPPYGELEYALDGLVIKVDSRSQRTRLGATSKAPRYMIAYKFGQNQALTQVKDIHVQVGKTGQLTPVAVLEPVQLSGTTVSRASLHNFDEMERLDVRIGDQVLVHKAGEIIPEVIGVRKELRTRSERPYPPPSKCPMCGCRVSKRESPNKTCRDPECTSHKNTANGKSSRVRAYLPVNRDRCEQCGGPVSPAERSKAKKTCVSRRCPAYGEKKRRQFVPPAEDHCDFCRGPVKVTYALFCDNPLCSSRAKETVVHFSTRGAMDIEGLGEALVEQLVEAGLVSNYADLYSLKKQDVAALERMGEKSAQNLMDGIEASKGRGLARLLFAMGIPHVGSHMAEVLAGHFGSMNALTAADTEALQAVQEVGPIVARAIVDFISRQSTRQVIADLKRAGVKMELPRAPRRENPNIAGKTFVVTGTLEHYSRDQIERLIKSLGGRAASSVSKNTDYLIAGENAGSKLDKARKLGVPVLTEAQFEKLRQDGEQRASR